MASSKTTMESKGPSCGNPYEILGLKIGATNEEISKAYKRLALKYHPDKHRRHEESQKQHAVGKTKKGKQDEEQLKSKFLTITEARNFLLDEEFIERRKVYDKALKSQQVRRQEEEKRESQMSERRQQLRAELQEKERKAAFSSTSSSRKSAKVDQQDRVEKLRKEGRELRKEHAARTFSMAATTASVAEQKSDEDQALHQVRLKWSRRSNNTNFLTEESLKLFLGEKFGPVSTVEFLGSKGNAALITFVNLSSVQECINSLLYSNDMRAYHVGKYKKVVEDDILPPSDLKLGETTHFETIHDRRLRQNEEREKMRRQMEEQEEDANGLDKASTRIASNATNKSYSSTASSSNRATTNISGDLMSMLYPPQLPLPLSDAEERMTDLERLEHMEQMVLPKCVSFI